MLLLDHGADVNGVGNRGRTALMDACSAGELPVVRALCEAGANVNVRDAPDGLAALHYAEQPDSCGRSVRTGAAAAWRWPPPTERSREAAGAPDHAGCVRVLLEHGARAGSFTRAAWYEFAGDEDVPDEYVVGFH